MTYPILNATAQTNTHPLFHNAYVDVKAHFGAAGDGSTDDTAEIQAAITAAGVGGTLLFPPGDYLISSTLTALDAQSWTGSGHSHWQNTTNVFTRIKYTGTAAAISLSSVHGCRLTGLRIECTNNTSTVIGVNMVDTGTGCFWNILDGCTIKGPATGTGVGLKMSGSFIADSFHSIRDCSFYLWDKGTLMSGYANTNNFSNVTWHACTTALSISATGADTQGGDHNLFSCLEIDGSNTNGIVIANNASRNAFVMVSDDTTTNSLNVASGVTATSFYNCVFPGTITDNTSGYETLYFNCSFTDPAGGASMVLAHGRLDIVETALPTAPDSNRARIYCRDNGSGKTQIVVRFATGAVQVMATEP